MRSLAPATIQVQPPCRRRCASVHLTRHWAQRSCSSSRREAGGPAAPLSVLAACSLPQLSRTALRFTDSPLAASHILGRTTPIQLGLPTPQTRRQVARSSLSGPVVAARLPLDWPLKHQAVAQPGAFTLSVSSSRRLPAGLPRAISPVAAGPCRSSGTTAPGRARDCRVSRPAFLPTMGADPLAPRRPMGRRSDDGPQVCVGLREVRGEDWRRSRLPSRTWIFGYNLGLWNSRTRFSLPAGRSVMRGRWSTLLI